MGKQEALAAVDAAIRAAGEAAPPEWLMMAIVGVAVVVSYTAMLTMIRRTGLLLPGAVLFLVLLFGLCGGGTIAAQAYGNARRGPTATKDVVERLRQACAKANGSGESLTGKLSKETMDHYRAVCG